MAAMGGSPGTRFQQRSSARDRTGLHRNAEDQFTRRSEKILSYLPIMNKYIELNSRTLRNRTILPLDELDRKILACLQHDATLPVAEIADRVGLSTTPCWRRIQKLEQAGVIRGRVALLDAARLNLGVTVFVAVKTNRHEIDWLERFQAAVAKLPEVVEFYRMSGETDYLLKIVVPDIAAYDAVYRRLIETISFSDVSSSFAMEQIKYTTALPLEYAVGERNQA
jgi:Lrp/AsnC family transcriptional regulator